eukprot:TRINITY_DN17886_c0_g1::TRINITY_DN17886_c0_g1_i1::g.11823::m.11823 TRINITY_DN17886_c0_g1::TRINITY_DN17886_c0_g1_i1::g.11823  ORF type:complete len:282 (-),score=67.78,sp/Q55C17/TECR_DICDI/29.20/3e-33,Steroid_dh/PF02544.11/5.2e+02,Steroid_dh/PF02544.11/9.6e-30,DUF1295/PF06966.7/11 TRINITY_DN17886_c0_g1_i1:199-1014(-)
MGKNEIRKRDVPDTKGKKEQLDRDLPPRKTTSPTEARVTVPQRVSHDARPVMTTHPLPPATTVSRTFVNVSEYLLAVLVYSLFFVTSSGQIHKSTTWQISMMMAWQMHYFKRVFEVFFVHVYSDHTMSISEALLEHIYYITFSAVVAYQINLPSFHLPPMYIFLPALSGFVFGEAGNFYCHLLLASLREEDDQARFSPDGFLFDYVSCPHYFFEMLTWISFGFMASTFGAYVWAGVCTIVLILRALERHRKYHAMFSNYPPERKAIIPFIL